MNTQPPLTLETPIHKIRTLSIQERAGLKRLKIERVRDLLYHFPSRYLDTADATLMSDVTAGNQAVVYGIIEKIESGKAWRRKTPLAKATVTDETQKIHVTWFHQPYLARMYGKGQMVRLQGKVEERNGKIQMINPDIEVATKVPIHLGASLFSEEETGASEHAVPVYPETRSISSRWILHTLSSKIFSQGLLQTIVDPLPEEIRKRYSLPDLATALIWIHTPKKLSDAEAARKRFAFEEMFVMQVKNEKERREYQEYSSFVVNDGWKKSEHVLHRLPFNLTSAQKRTLDDIFADLSRSFPMSRLVEGDVGSGKTAIAALAAAAVIDTAPENHKNGRLQVGLMAPTQILAEQHFKTFIDIFKHTNVEIGLLTSGTCFKFPSKLAPEKPAKVSKAQLKKWIESGNISILIGTHALIEKSVSFKNLAFVVVDEQHRFGTRARSRLRNKDSILPHLLSMTATPIPRTLALTAFGNLDLSLLDELPPGRQQVITKIVTSAERKSAYEKIREEVKSGRQAYVICPRIEEPDPDKLNALQLTSVEEEYKKLSDDIFPDLTIETLHGKMSPKEKDEKMQRFARHEADILIATSVVEVGVNVPNATLIMIEGAERFGLSQLHQLRGRVQRGSYQPYCFLMTDSKGEVTTKRLRVLTTAANGFELAEEDLKLRGPGDLVGRRQSGLSDLAMEALKNIRLVEAAQKEARKLLDLDPALAYHPQLKKLTAKEEKIHLE